MERIEQPISDPHITSCLEMEEERMEAEKAAVKEVIQQINTMVEQTTERDEIIIREISTLEQQLAHEEIIINAVTALQILFIEKSKEKLRHLEQISHQLNEKIPLMQNLERELENERLANQAKLHADPIFKLILEELHLKRRLENLGVHVLPPRNPDA